MNASPRDSVLVPSKTSPSIESRTFELGQQIFRFAKTGRIDFWYERLMDLATRDERVKSQLFRFVDVLPMLIDFEQKREHLAAYVRNPKPGAPWPLSLSLLSRALAVPGLDRLLVGFSDVQVKQIARRFIIGENANEALPLLISRRRKGLAFTLDILGEYVFSENESQIYYDRYQDLIENVGRAAESWELNPQLDVTPLGEIPKANVSIKLSAFDPKIDPICFESAVNRIVTRITPLLRIAKKRNVFVNFDMEQCDTKDVFREVFKRIASSPEFSDYRHLGIVVQAYLKSAVSDVEDWIAYAKLRGTPFTIRLVKGAYWDSETIQAAQNDWPSPVFERKKQTDASFERSAKLLLSAYPAIELAVGSHNARSMAYVMAHAEALKLPKNAFEFQMLYGMAEGFKYAVSRMGYRLREYDPVGDLIAGLSYLVRRLLENSSNDSFLKQSFMDGTEINRLLAPPE